VENIHVITFQLMCIRQARVSIASEKLYNVCIKETNEKRLCGEITKLAKA